MSWIWIALFLGILANGVRLRARARALRRMPRAGTPPLPDHLFLVAEGVCLDMATRQAASAYARSEGLQVLDLVPADLSVERALWLLRLIEPATYAKDPIIPGRGAGHAILVERSVLERSRLFDASRGDVHDIAPADFARATLQLKMYADTRADIAIAPDLRAAFSEGSAAGLRFWGATFASGLPLVFGVMIAENALLALGLLRAFVPALLALLAFQVQPLLIFSGSALAPHDLGRALLLRWVDTTRTVLRLIGLWRAQRSPGNAAQRREEYAALLAHGLDRFFEARRPDCPLCGSLQLQEHLRATDRVQFKPGVFVLDRCTACGHVFQNPRLSLEGLDFYYRDFYDRDGEDALETVFASGDSSYRDRAETLRGHAAPGRWLDVGTGHAHFCIRARSSWPQTRFDGLDMTASIEAAERRGWVTKGYRGLFPELAQKLESSYDVVSMHHYLEHTREPLEELAAAALVLRPGGHLLIEVPDPECSYARLLGQHWVAWLQPQHQHFLSIANLESALAALGFQVVTRQRGPAHIPSDFAFLFLSLSGTLAAPLDRPWAAPDAPWRPLWRMTVLTALSPLIAAGLLIDHLLQAHYARHPARPSSAYRLLARKREVPA